MLKNRTLFALIANLLLLELLTAQAPDKVEVPEDPFAAIEAMKVHPPVADGYEVTVIDGDTKQPIAGASVMALGDVRNDAAREHARKLEKAMRERNFDRRTLQVAMSAMMGTRYRTDENGVARIPRLERAMAIVIFEKRIGRWDSRRKAPAELFAPRFAKVEVVNARGKPARDVEIGLGTDSNYFHAFERRRTDKDGRCEIDIGDYRNQGALRLQAMIVSQEEIFVKVPEDAKLDEPFRLQLPPCGMVRFILYGDDDRPSNDLERAVLNFTLKADSRPRMGRQTSMTPTRLDPDGAMFSHVGLDLDISVWAKLKSVPDGITFKAKGPTREHEMIIVDGRINAGPPIASFRVLDQQGQPLANEPLGRVFYSERRYQYADAKTDAEGMLTLTFKDELPEAVYLIRRADGLGTRYRGAAKFVTGELKPGRQTLDDVQLQDEPVIASGTVIDMDGKPVASVWLSSKTTITSSGSGGGSRSGERVYYRHRVQTDEQGRFEMRELSAVDNELRISLESDEWTLAEGAVKLAVGDKNEIIKVASATTIEGELLGDLGDTHLEMKVVNRETSREFSGSVHKGKFTFPQLPAGDYDVSFGRNKDFVIENVRSRKKGEEQDPRLKTKDWQQHFELVEVTVTDENDKPLKDVVVYYYVTYKNGSTGNGVYTDENGKARRLSPLKNTYIEVRQKGYEPQKIEKDFNNRVVKLKAVAPVDIRFVGMPEFPDPTYAQVRVVGARFYGSDQGRIKEGRTKVYPTNIGKVTIELRVGTDYVRDMPRETRDALRRAMNLRPIKFEIKGTRTPGPVQEIQLEEGLIEDIQACIDDAKEVLKQKDK